MKRTMQTPNTRKAMIAVATVGLFALGASAAFAQKTLQTADMSVTGTIVPAACSANFEGGSVVDFGTIRLIDLPANAYHPLGSKNTELNVVCSSLKRVKFYLTDQQATSRISDATMRTLLGASFENNVLGLGTATVSGKPVNLGGFVILPLAPDVNGTVRNMAYSRNNGGSWTNLLTYPLRSDGEQYSAANSATPVTGTSFRFPLRITAALNYGSNLQVAEDTPLNGQALFTIIYE